MYRIIFLALIFFFLLGGCYSMVQRDEPRPAVIDLSQYPGPDEEIHLTVAPELVKAGVPEYPRLANQAGLEATVFVKALVDASGKVIRGMVFKSSGSKAGFDEASVAAVYKCVFEPAYLGIKPVPAWVVCRVEFHLENGTPETQIIIEE
jgi:TonB family protein